MKTRKSFLFICCFAAICLSGTLSSARIFGVESMMGSLEKGKTANIVIADGDILEQRTNIKYVFIDGIETDLFTRYEELWRNSRKDSETCAENTFCRIIRLKKP